MAIKSIFVISGLSTLLGGTCIYGLLRSGSATTQYSHRNKGKTDNAKGDIDDLETNEEDQQAYLKSDAKEDQFHPEDIASVNSRKTTLRQILQKKNAKVVDAQTSMETMGNILISRMFPSYNGLHEFQENQLFPGSPALKLKGNKYTDIRNKELFILQKNSDADLKTLRQACIKALDRAKTSDDEIYKLKEWCSVPTIKDVLARHKFRFPTQNKEWMQIINSDWVKKTSLKYRHNFFSSEETAKMIINDEDEKIKIIQNKCKDTLAKPFQRLNFPATQQFISQSFEKSKGTQTVDEFQEAALFCTVPITAEEYVKKAMKGEIKEGSVERMKKDYCYVEGKNDISYYKNIKTIDPMEGKSFWCAVRMVYRKSKERPLPSPAQ